MIGSVGHCWHRTVRNSGAFRAVDGVASGYIGFKNKVDKSQIYCV
jgi:hypothetical protein